MQITWELLAGGGSRLSEFANEESDGVTGLCHVKSLDFSRCNGR